MIQKFIVKKEHPRLLLFFAGWGADPRPFRHYRPAGHDYAVCYDYRSLQIDTSAWTTYDGIDVVAWSMGVWAAQQILPQLDLRLGSCVAINGTLHPVSNTHGIPLGVWRITRNNLCPESMHRFMLRMCAKRQSFHNLLRVCPRRPIGELRQELDAIKEASQTDAPLSPLWTEAFVALWDRIIPPANQQREWEERHVPIHMAEEPHYSPEVFNYYLRDIWTKHS